MHLSFNFRSDIDNRLNKWKIALAILLSQALVCTVLGIWLNVNEKMKVYKIRFQKDILIWSKFHLMKTDLVLFLSFYVLLRMDLWMAAIRRVLRQKRRHWFRAKRMNSMILLTRVMLFKHKRHSMTFNFYILHYENPPHYIIEYNLQEFRNCYCSYCCHIWRNRMALKKFIFHTRSSMIMLIWF